MKRLSVVLAIFAVSSFNGVVVAHPGHGSAVERASVSPGHYLIEPEHLPTTLMGIALFVACSGVARMLFRKNSRTVQSREFSSPRITE